MDRARADETFVAIDLGASSGRVVGGRLQDGRVTLEELHRFANRPVRLPDGLHWNLLTLFDESLRPLRGSAWRGIAVDSWGVDYALLDERGRVLGLPFHYRDDRTDGMVERAFARIPQPQAYAVAGIQTLPINTMFQLLADTGSAALRAAHRIALVPDLLAFWTTGELANERTNASTTGLLDARSGEWARRLIEGLGLPSRIFGTLVEPGTELGHALQHHQLGNAPVYAVGSHDTASAYAGTPLGDRHAAVLSSGTWSLVGIELAGPVLTDAAREANLTNERGVDGTTRLLKNVMGLWLEQECARVWNADFAELHDLAAEATSDVPLFDPDDEAFLRPGDMPVRIADWCRRSGQRAPADRGETVRSISLSLACKTRLALEALEAASGADIRTLHVIGGGVRNRLLCQLTADVTCRDVLAGPIEATALGNVLMQARAAGDLGSLAEMRAVAAASASPVDYAPSTEDGEETFQRFLDVTGLSMPAVAWPSARSEQCQI